MASWSWSEDVRIGQISFNKKKVLGTGSHNTLVYRGKFASKNVAIKKIPLHFSAIAEKEKDLLLHIDTHPNIIRYYHTEKDNDGYYIALTLCEYTLCDYVSGKFENLNLTPHILMKEITTGLHFLHGNQIIHHDLKPMNILISHPNHRNERTSMIADFGISKQTTGTRDSVTLTTSRGTEGFTAPEVYRNQNSTYAIDVFALGCTFFYVVSGGKYLFESKREVTQEAHYNLAIQTLNEADYSGYQNLILKMVALNATNRPTCEGILFHHVFWDNEKKMRFIHEISDYLGGNENERNTIDDSVQFCGPNWHDKVSENFVTDLVLGKMNQGKKSKLEEIPQDKREEHLKKYDGTKFSTLLRAMRNVFNHFGEIILKSRSEISSTEGCLVYCLDRFPKIMPFLYATAVKWKNENVQRFYLQNQASVGDIIYRPEPKLKNTRNGSIVYKGQFKNHKVAVKKYPSALAHFAENKWKILANVVHPNIIRLYQKENVGEIIFIAEKLEQYNLTEYVENFWNDDKSAPMRFLKQITNGLMFLHERKIIHCNLNPLNVLISYPNKLKFRRAIISDFEISQERHEKGIQWEQAMKKISKQWLAPELRNATSGQFTEASDTFSLGCIYLYILSNGNQDGCQLPAELTESLYNQQIEKIVSSTEGTSFLVKWMMEFSPESRIASKDILSCPQFWTTNKKIRFCQSLLDPVHKYDQMKERLLSTPGKVRNKGWKSQLYESRLSSRVKMRISRDLKDGEWADHELVDIQPTLDMCNDSISSIVVTMINILVQIPFRSQKYYIQDFLQLVPEIPDFIFRAMLPFKNQLPLCKFSAREHSATTKWDEIKPSIFQHIASKIPPLTLLKCQTLCKPWHQQIEDFCTNWPWENESKWTESSFENVIKSPVNWKEIVCKSSEEWLEKRPPTLLQTLDVGENTASISLSQDGNLLAVSCSENFKIYETMTFQLKFSRKCSGGSCFINETNSMTLLATGTTATVFKIEEGLPTVCSVSCSHYRITQPWFGDNIFMSSKEENKLTTFWLNKVPEEPTSETDHILRTHIFQVQGETLNMNIFKLADGFILIYTLQPRNIIIVKTFSDTGINSAKMKLETQANMQECIFPSEDQKFHIQGEVKEYTIVPGTK